MSETENENGTEGTEGTEDVYAAFGTASYEQEARCKKMKLRQPDKSKGEDRVVLIAKIMPPMFSYRDRKGINFAFFRALHWGWETVDPANPSRKVWLKFVCTCKKDRQTKAILTRCGQCEKLDAAESLCKELEVEATKAKTDVLLNPEYQTAKSYLKQYSLKKKWYVNAVDLDGQPMELELSSKTFFKLKDKIDAITKGLEADLGGAMDPLDVRGGCWFKFTSTGNGVTKDDAIEIYKEPVTFEVNGKPKTVQEPKPGVLASDVLKRAVDLLPDISVSKAAILSIAEIDELVNGSDDPLRIARIFQMPWALGTSDAGEPESADDTVPF